MYVDPGSGALAWQLLLGVLVSAGFYARRFLARLARRGGHER